MSLLVKKELKHQYQLWQTYGWNFNFQKSSTLEITIFKHAVCLENTNNFKFKWFIVLTGIQNKSEKLYIDHNLPNSAFQNPEIRNNPVTEGLTVYAFHTNH